MRETKVRLDGWCEGRLGQQSYDGGGCVSIRERLERVETLCSFAALLCSGGYHLQRGGGMPLHDAVGINCKKGTTTENQAAVVKYMG